MAGDYYYVEPYHHDNTTKHGESNWSWVKLWQDVYGRPVPLCCPCKEGGEGGEKKKKRSRRKKQEGNHGTVPAIIPAFPHPLCNAVGAHVKLKKTGKGNHGTVPAIIPACSSCNRSGKEFKWNADAILLTGSRKNGTEPIFFGKLFLHEEKGGVYWTKVHKVMRKGTLTGVQGETSKRTRVGVAPQLPTQDIRSRGGNEAHEQKLIKYYLNAEEFVKSRLEINKKTGRARHPKYVSENVLKKYVSKKGWFKKEWWYYEDDTGFVYDLLRGATDKRPIVCVINRAQGEITKKYTEFSRKEVIDRVQRVHVKHADEDLRMPMPTVLDQFVHCMRCLAIEHGQDSTIYMDNILKFASLQIEEEKNDARVQEFVSNGFLYQS